MYSLSIWRKLVIELFFRIQDIKLTHKKISQLVRSQMFIYFITGLRL